MVVQEGGAGYKMQLASVNVNVGIFHLVEVVRLVRRPVQFGSGLILTEREKIILEESFQKRRWGETISPARDGDRQSPS